MELGGRFGLDNDEWFGWTWWVGISQIGRCVPVAQGRVDQLDRAENRMMWVPAMGRPGARIECTKGWGRIWKIFGAVV